MDEIKVGDYIYDISIVKGVYQANQYKVLYIDDVYIYCINNDKVKGRFNKSDSVLYKNINEAIHRAKILNIDEKQRQKKLKL